MISYSLTFPARTKCKFCSGGPKYYSCVFAGNLNKDVLKGVQSSINYQSRKDNLHNGLAAVNYLFLPKKNIKLQHASANVAAYSIGLRRYKNLLPKKEVNKFLFRASYACECFKTVWATRDFLFLEKNHISERLSFKSYPSQIIMI